jgi:hypothetical protein
MLYLAQYRQSPVGEYREIIVAPALLRWQGRIGAWISHIVVDSEASMIAGRSIWGLPKELASIRWPELSRPRRFVRLPFVGAALTSRDGIANNFSVRGTARVGIARAAIDSMAGANLEALGLRGPQKMYVCEDASITIGPPRSD